MAWSANVNSSTSERFAHLASWAQGEPTEYLPTVVLSDVKTASTARHPFALFYDAFQRELIGIQTVVAGGLSFGDRPINELLAVFLGEDQARQLLVWRRTDAREEILGLLRSLPRGRNIADEQVVVDSVQLPSADAVTSLPRS